MGKTPIRLEYGTGRGGSSKIAVLAVRITSAACVVPFLFVRIPFGHGGLSPITAFSDPELFSCDDILVLLAVTILVAPLVVPTTSAVLVLALVAEALLGVVTLASVMLSWPYGGAIRDNALAACFLAMNAVAIGALTHHCRRSRQPSAPSSGSMTAYRILACLAVIVLLYVSRWAME